MGELFYPTYDLSDFSWDSLNHTLNHTALTAELRGVPATDPTGSFSNGSLAFRVCPGAGNTGNVLREHRECPQGTQGMSCPKQLLGRECCTCLCHPSEPCPLQVTAYEAGGREGRLPSLLHTANSSQLEFILAGVAPRGNSSRFVLEVATVEEAGAVRRLRSQRSIDDEYTPTIFEVSPKPGGDPADPSPRVLASLLRSG